MKATYSYIALFLLATTIAKAQQADTLKPNNAEPKTPEKFQVLSGIPLTIGGYIQSRFVSNQQAGIADAFDIRRARLDLKGQVTPHWDYRVQFEFAGTPKLLDGIISYKYKSYLKISAGQFYIPFSNENTTADNKLIFIDRSQTVNALASREKDVIGNQNGRDAGVQLSGAVYQLKDRALFDYYIAVFNGAGINTTDNNEAKDLSSRLLFHPIKGLDIGGSYYNGWGKFGTPSHNQLRERIGAEFGYNWKALVLQGEFIQGKDGVTTRSGFYGLAGVYVYKKLVQVVARYDSYDPDISAEKTNDATTNATLGVNLYFNANAKLQINYTNRIEQGTAVNNDLIAAQLQLGF